MKKMTIYISGLDSYSSGKLKLLKFNYMASVFDINEMKSIFRLVDKFFLDSGVFSILTSKNGIKKENVDSLVDHYIDVINTIKPDYFVEIDLDKFFDYEQILKWRRRIEKGTGRQPVLVFHTERGLKNYLDEIRDYKYHGVPGRLRTQKELIRYLTDKAHENDCLVHGFGWLSIKNFWRYDFDSVDGSLIAVMAATRKIINFPKDKYEYLRKGSLKPMKYLKLLHYLKIFEGFENGQFWEKRNSLYQYR